MDTVQEIIALRQFADLMCHSAPHFLELSESTVQPEMHVDGIIGGYFVAILMTQVPGGALRYDSFCKMQKIERDEIRDAFKEALM